MPFGLVLSPPVGIALAAGLTVLRRSRFADLPRQPAVLAAWTGMVVLGIASGLSSPSPRTAAVGLAGVAVLWWLWGVGRFGVDDGPGFTVGVQRATAVVGALALAVALARAELRVSLGPVGLSLTIMSPENKGTVLGLGGNGLGPLLAFGAMVALGRAATCRRWPDRLEGLAVAVLNLSAALALGVRNALWGGAVGAAALVPVAGVTVVAVVVGAGAAVLGLRRDVLARFLELLDWRTEQARWGVWQASWRMLRDHPWLGVGPAQFHMVHPQYALPQSAHLTDPHSMYLKLATEWGVPATLLFFGWMVRELTVAWAHRAEGYRWALAAGVVAFLAMGVFDTPLFTLHISGPVLVGLGVAAASAEGRTGP